MLMGGLFVGLFIIAMMAFAVNIGQNYNQTANTMTSNQLNLTGIQRNLNETSSNAFKWKNSFWSSIPFIGVGIVIIQTLFDVGKLIAGSFFGGIGLFFTILVNIFGVPTLVIGVLMTAALVGLIVAINAWYTGRQ